MIKVLLLVGGAKRLDGLVMEVMALLERLLLRSCAQRGEATIEVFARRLLLLLLLWCWRETCVPFGGRLI